MQLLKDMRIKTKLICGFGIIIFLTVILVAMGATSIKRIDTAYSFMFLNPVKAMELITKSDTDFKETRRIVATMGWMAGDTEQIKTLTTASQASFESACKNVAQYQELLKTDVTLSDAQRSDWESKSDSLQSYLTQYQNEVLVPMQQLALKGEKVKTKDLIVRGSELYKEMSPLITTLIDGAVDSTLDYSDVLTSQSNATALTMVGLGLLIMILSIIVAVVIASLIAKPLRELVEVADAVASGNLNVNIRNDAKDETGMLARSFSAVVYNINHIITDIDSMYKNHEDGMMDDRIASEKYEGSYKTMTNGINKMTGSYVDMLHDIFNVLGHIAKGSFNEKLQAYKGQKAVANKETDLLLNTIKDIVAQIDMLATAGANGNLNARSDASQFSGEWANIVDGLNDVLNAVLAPINEAQAVLSSMSEGDFTNTMNGNYKGDFATMKTSIHSTQKSIASYITEITTILQSMADGDLRHNIDRQYLGQFSSIKDSIHTISSSLSKTMNEINMASEQVLAGARQISESSMSLAEGTTEQASSIEELNASIDLINGQTQSNALNATDANALSQRSVENAQSGNKEMHDMLTSMDGIKESSQSIAKIIKVIEDIAFQTNLLALNAAVEAARAGAMGKGFSVVAEEVRNLADKSQRAAKETADLIENSISRVESGQIIAQRTADSLRLIVDNAGEVSGLITGIAHSSNEQALSISQVSIGLSQISQVIQTNSATSEESASASQQLSSQAEVLRQMVSFFKF